MKFSCTLNNIDYVFNTSEGMMTDPKFHFYLNSKKRKKLQKGEMGYYHLEIVATKEDLELNFVVQGLPLSHEPEVQVEELEDFFENLVLFSKIENQFQLQEEDSTTPPWAENE